MENSPSNNSENKNVVKAAGIVGSATMLSRIFGFIRDMVVAGLFGTAMTTDAFFVAFRIPNLLRRLLAEGSLTISFVPVFTEYLKKKSKEEAFELAQIAFTVLSIVLVFISLLGVLFSPFIVTLIAPGFLDSPNQFDLTVFLTRMMFPYIFFISLVALCMGILNSLRHFAAPALAPVVLNVSMITAALLLRGLFQEPIIALAIGVMVGGVLQLAMQWPFIIKMGLRIRFKFNLKHEGLRKIGVLLVPAVIGGAVDQINIFIGTILASLLAYGSVSYLYYADRIVELPLGIFAIAIGTASLPSFSEQAARGEMAELKKTIAFSLRLILFITIPAMIALMALRVPILSVLFQRGKFDLQSTLMTAQALLYYTLGLWAFSLRRIIVSAFFSLQDTKTPMKAAIVALVINVVFSILLIGPLKHGGLALATSIASAVNVVLLTAILVKRIGTFFNREFYISVIKVTAASILMLLSIFLINLIRPWNNHGSFDDRFIFLVVCIAVGMITFGLSAYCLKCQEMLVAFEMLKRKLKRKIK